MESRYPKTVEALIERIKMDACPRMGDLSSQCCASLEALENMVEQNRKLRDLVAELEYLDSEAKQGAELAEEQINELKAEINRLTAMNKTAMGRGIAVALSELSPHSTEYHAIVTSQGGYANLLEDVEEYDAAHILEAAKFHLSDDEFNALATQCGTKSDSEGGQ